MIDNCVSDESVISAGLDTDGFTFVFVSMEEGEQLQARDKQTSKRTLTFDLCPVHVNKLLQEQVYARFAPR